MAFQDLYRGQIYSEQPAAEALAAGTIVSLGADGWEAAADETVARGVLLVDVVAAPTDDADGINVYAGGITGTAAKIYVGNPAPVDTGDCIVLTSVVADADWSDDDHVYVGNGLLYNDAQNSGASVGRVLKYDSTDEVKIKFRFAV